MNFILKLKDRPRYELRRLTLALAELCRGIAASDGRTKARFEHFSKALAGARPVMRGAGMGRADLLARLETAGACLEQSFFDLELHELKPDQETKETLLFTERALQLQADFIARPAAAGLLAEAAKNVASALKGLALALRASRTDSANFIPNLKFSRIYSDLEKTVCAVDDCAELLARTL